jgi:hypothetical protein
MSLDARTRLRNRRPCVESLETRALLSAISVSLTTNQSVYQSGQPIQMTFTETNTSNQRVNVEVGPSIDGFDVTQNGKTIWQSNAGVNPMYIVLESLNPGQSLTLHATWDDTPSQAQSLIMAGGTYTVTNQLDPSGPSATFQVEPAVVSSIITDKPVYQAGEPIVFTFTDTNTSTQPVTLAVDPTDFAVTASGGGSIWQSNPADANSAPTTVTLQPGQSVTQTATWNGARSSTGPSLSLWGSFVVANPNAPGLSTKFQINDPLVSTLSTNQSVYQVGQPVDITFVETNSSPNPVVIFPSGAFAIKNVATDTAVFTQPVGQNAMVTLQPGQSFTQTSTWTATQPGNYDFDYMNGQVAATGSFQVVQTPTGTAPPGQNPQPPITPVNNPPGQNPLQPIVVGNNPPVQNPPPITVTLTTNRQQYGPGQPVIIGLTLKNSSSQSITIPPSSASDGFSVISGSTIVWHTARTTRAIKAKARTLSPGESLTFQAIWNGKPISHGAKKLPAGSYSVLVMEAGHSAETTIQIG